LLGTIDPAAYYTVFADNSQRLFDAASRDKIYVRVESSTFYALYGDFETGFDQTYFASYQRTATGVKAEALLGQVQASGFAARVGSRHRRDEFQGAGLSGPYNLSGRRIVPNSETVAIEVRDRLRSEIIIERRELVRFIDYTIDLLSGTISFAQPIISRDAALNPRFAIVEYDVDNLGAAEWNAGLRATWNSDDGNLRIGATGVTDKGEDARTNLGALDLRLRLGAQTEIRAETAVSENAGTEAAAFLVELEHHSGAMDFLVYARQIDADYGVGQQNVAERGLRKIGGDARMQINDVLTLAASVWHEESLTDEASRNAVDVRASWRKKSTDGYFGIAHLADSLADGSSANSTILQAGATQRLFDNALKVTAATSIGIGGTDSVGLPARHSLSLRYAVTQSVRAIATYEIARGNAIDANTLKVGAEVTPWEGGTLITTLGQEKIGRDTLEADANRIFAAFALGHSFRVGERLVVDATIDGNRTLDGDIAADDLVNPAQPAASGGQFGQAGSLGEDFTAATLGAAWGAGPWNARVRGEYRDGEFANRAGAELATIRRLGEGSVVGGGITWTLAKANNGATTEIIDAALSAAHRPNLSEFSFLGKLEYRSDAVTGSVAGEVGAAGRTALLVDGDARSRRVLAGLSTNWTPSDDEDSASRTEFGLFVSVRHNFDKVEGFDLAGTSVLGGLDARIGVGERVELGGRLSVRHNLGSRTTKFAIGPEIGFVPADNVLVSVGYHLVGFRDSDFAGARATDKGVFASIRIKLDDDSFDFLGIGR
jgi:hypothetical protein